MSAPPHPQALRCFTTVAREGSVSKAAAKLHLSQPAVSLQLKNLEESIGVKLFERTPQGLTLTRAGSALLPEAENALAAAVAFQRAAISLKSPVRQILRVGTILDPEFTRLGAFLKELLEKAPRIETQLRHGMSDDVLAQVARHELDVGFYLDHPSRETSRPPTSFAKLPLKRFVYRVAAPPGWEPRVKGKGWKALGALPWLATPPASAHRRLLDAIYAPLGISLKRVGMTDDELSMLDLLESGVGLSLVRDAVADEAARRRGIVIADKVSIECLMSFVCVKARIAEPAIATAWEAMRRAWQG